MNEHTTSPKAAITVDALQPSDYAAWQRLGQGYSSFYERELPQATYERTWTRLMSSDRIHGFAARIDGRLLGITHYLFQPSIWSADVLESVGVDLQGVLQPQRRVKQVDRDRIRHHGILFSQIILLPHKEIIALVFIACGH